MAASSGDHHGGGGAVGGDDSACSTPFVSAPSSPARDAPPQFLPAGCFYSAPASPARGGAGAGEEYGGEYGLDCDFDFSSQFPSPAAAAMSSADELFHNGQIRPMRLSSFLLRPQALPPLAGEPVGHPPELPEAPAPAPAPADERGRFRSRSVHRRSRSLSPFRTHWLSPSSSPAPAANTGGPSAAAEAAPSASRSSSSSSTASSASSSSSRNSRRWRFLKDLLHRSKSDGGKHPPPRPSAAPLPPKRNPSPPSARGRGRTKSSAHARLYEARRAETEEMRRRTFLPYRQGLLLGCLGLSSRGYGAMHGLAASAAAAAKPKA
ncbi:hypothetical protein ACP70R_032290 [Stipagrostis hirtigluma subsp. patula]